MAFWIGILVGGTFAWFAIKLGFYQTWALVFNIIISIYLAIYLQPVVAHFAVVGNTPYSTVLSIAVVAAASFLVLQGISYTFLIGQFNVSFPKLFDTLGCGILGFLTGFLVWSFLSLLIYIAPVSQDTFVKGFGFKDEYRETTVSYISQFCNVVNAIVSQDGGVLGKQTISNLLKRAGPKTQEMLEKPESITPSQPTEADNSEQNQPGPPPEIDEGI